MNNEIVNSMRDAQCAFHHLVKLPEKFTRHSELNSLFGKEFGWDRIEDMIKSPEMEQSVSAIFTAFAEYNKAREKFIAKKFAYISDAIFAQLPPAGSP